MSHIFPNEQAAALGMLLEVTELLNQKTIDYAVIGGWIPYLFNSKPIPHTGTYDVDIVLNSALSKQAVIDSLDQLVGNAGYRRAPKNAFQIYRELNVTGEPMIFHVDFLHRKYADDTDSLIMQWGRYQSIRTPGTDVIFTHREIRAETISGVGTNGQITSVNIAFASEAGFLSSKGRSVGFGKRRRDGFDVFLLIKQSKDIHALKARSKALMSDPIFRKSMERLREQFLEEDSVTTQAAEYLLQLAPEIMLGQVADNPDDPRTQHANIEIAKISIRSTVEDFLVSLGLSEGA